jgi:hypothetical protein
MATSNTYEFGNSDFDTLLRTSFQLCGLLPSEVDGWKVKLALQSANLILSDWANRGDNLWLSQTMVMPIVPGQQTYLLPKQVTYVKELQAVQLQEISDGARVGGVDGTLSYTRLNFSTFVSPRVAAIYPTSSGLASLSLQHSGAGKPWTDASQKPWEASLEQYYAHNAYMFIPSAPIMSNQWRFLNVDKSLTQTNISSWDMKLFTQKTSRLLVSLSENDYCSIPQPQQSPSSISSYYLDRQIQPTINLWPVPDNTYDAFVMKCMTTAQDAGDLINRGQVPQRFIRALVYEIAAELSLQFSPERYQILRPEADKLFDRAATEDRERVPLRIVPNFMSYT